MQKKWSNLLTYYNRIVIIIKTIYFERYTVMRKRSRATSENAVLIRRYGLSSDNSKKIVSEKLDEMRGILKELTALSKLRGFRQRAFVEEKTEEARVAFEKASRAVLWELNTVLSCGKSVVAILESEDLKRAMEMRVRLGEYRAEVLERHDLAVANYRKILGGKNSGLEA